MINTLLSGKVHGQPETRVGKSGKTFCTAKLIVPTDAESCWANVVAFREDAIRSLMALSAGDSVSVVGTAKVGAYLSKTGEPRPTLDVVAEAVLSVYEVTKRRKAAARPDPDSGHWLEGQP